MNDRAAGALLTTGDVAERLALSQVTVKRLLAAGSLRCVRIGRSVRFTPEAVSAFIAEHSRG